jgi:hypothetical protein
LATPLGLKVLKSVCLLYQSRQLFGLTKKKNINPQIGGVVENLIIFYTISFIMQSLGINNYE